MRFKWMLAAGMTLTMVALGQKSNSPEVMLGAGLHQEEVEANCKEAIQIYRKVLAEKSAPRSVAGRAQLHIGICQEKLGQREARIAYETVRSRYADLPEIVAEAQSRIAGLGGGEALQQRQLSARHEIEYDTLSTDGQWLGGTDGITGDLILTHTATLETRKLVHGTANETPVNLSWAGVPILSPDQRQVAYFWHDSSDALLGELRVMPNEPGARSRTLTGYEYPNTYPLAWSRDGKSILASLDTYSIGRKIAWVSVSDQSIKVIKTFEDFRSSRVPLALSPDGKYIAYSSPVRGDSRHLDSRHLDSPDSVIYVISAVDGAPLWDISLGDINEEPVWTADGSQLLFSSNSSGTFGLWSVPVRDGKKAGAPAPLTSGLGRIGAIGMSPSGTFYYKPKASEGQPPLGQIFVADLDQRGGRARGGADITESLVGWSPSWSRDGEWIAFNRPNNIVIRSMSNGMEWEFASTFLPPHFDDSAASQPLWYLDGRVEPRFRFSNIVEISNGQPKETTADPRLPPGTLSPDEKTLYRLLPPDEKTLYRLSPGGFVDWKQDIEVIDAATLKRKQLLTVPGYLADFAVSPDGNTLSIVNRPDPKGPRRLARMGVDGSGFRYLFSGVSLRRAQVAWTPDGRSILFIQEDNEQSRIMRMSTDGGQPEFSGISVPGLSSFDLSPDGSRIVYAATSHNNNEVFALDNLLGTKKRTP